MSSKSRSLQGIHLQISAIFIRGCMLYVDIHGANHHLCAYTGAGIGPRNSQVLASTSCEFALNVTNEDGAW